MRKPSFFEQLITENKIDTIKELLKTKSSLERVLKQQQRDKTDIVKTALDNRRYEILNIFGQSGLFSTSKVNLAEYTLTRNDFNEQTKLKYLQLFHYWGYKIDISFTHHGAYVESFPHAYSTLSYVIEKDYLEIFKWILKTNITKKLSFDDTVLQFSIKSDSSKILEAILSNKTHLRKREDINSLTEGHERTLLGDFFIYWFNFSLNKRRHFENKALIRKCETLIKYGFDINLKNGEGNTILHLLVKKLFEVDGEEPEKRKVFMDITEFIKYLKTETESDSSIRDRKGKTPLELLRKLPFKDPFKTEMVATFLK